jgi:hypothetical protein
MRQDILNVGEVGKLITAGNVLLLAGEESLLRQLPQGHWIGGTIPYFISPADGGVVSRDKIFVTDISEVAESADIVAYDQNSLARIYTEAGDSGFSFLIVPAMSQVHSTFALNAPNYKDFGSQPLLGWVAGVHLDDLGKVTPKVFDGSTGKAHEQEALAMHVTLVQGKSVDVGIVNIFEQGDGDTLTFAQDGFSCTEVMVNGAKENFADYLTRNNLDTKLPLVADYYGALVNISFQSVDAGEVKFYAPVFSGIRYKHAKPITNYAALFNEQLRKNKLNAQNLVFSCNCILNYLYSELEGQKTDPFVGPITFGEIAYQLLNQTLVYLEVHDR